MNPGTAIQAGAAARRNQAVLAHPRCAGRHEPQWCGRARPSVRSGRNSSRRPCEPDTSRSAEPARHAATASGRTRPLAESQNPLRPRMLRDRRPLAPKADHMQAPKAKRRTNKRWGAFTTSGLGFYTYTLTQVWSPGDSVRARFFPSVALANIPQPSVENDSGDSAFDQRTRRRCWPSPIFLAS